jgi:hypothetical protein
MHVVHSNNATTFVENKKSFLCIRYIIQVWKPFLISNFQIIKTFKLQFMDDLKILMDTIQSLKIQYISLKMFVC